MSVMMIHSNVRDYTVSFQETSSFLAELERFPQRLFVIDENVWAQHGTGCLSTIPPTERMIFPVSEERKTLDSVMEIYDRLMECSAKKNMSLISIGGGIVQDVSGFVASTLYRGLHWVFIPTTLLAQSDSCIGSKTSLNYKRFKNLIGTFYPPAEVHIYPHFIGTLGESDFLSGLGEVAKLHLMGGAETTHQLVTDLSLIMQRDAATLLQSTRTSLAIKLSYMEGDEFDTGRRNLLNFGHCFGHALETVSNYAIPHGQAVIIGMLFANISAVRRGWLNQTLAAHLADGLLLKSLSVSLHREYFSPELILESMRHDKKRIGDGLVMVLMKDDYDFIKVTDYREEELMFGIHDLLEILGV